MAPLAPIVVMFARYPVPGMAKTRLIPLLGADGAADVHRQLCTHTVAQLRASGLAFAVASTGATPADFQHWLGADITCVDQGSGDLGDRLLDAATWALAGHSAVLIIGSDCPELTPAHLQGALAALETSDVVFGPALDGGYYLIGLKVLHAALFSAIAWSTSDVLTQSLAACAAAGLSVAQLAPLGDIDTPADWQAWQARCISVIIPALNEADELPATLASAAGADEIILVDGGSSDPTVAIATAHGARCLSARGRAAQMNAGAAAATSGILIFLHADTQLPPGWPQLVRECLADPGVVLGSFQLSFRASGVGLRTVAAGANLRSRWLRAPYGDQALFLRQADFVALGGYADVPILEDHLLVRRAARAGRIALLPACVSTSARRWRTRGLLRTFAINQLVMLGHMCGVGLARLAGLYRF